MSASPIPSWSTQVTLPLENNTGDNNHGDFVENSAGISARSAKRKSLSFSECGDEIRELTQTKRSC